MSMKEKKEETEGIPEFVSSALRGPRQGAFENLLAQYCSLAVVSTSLKKINLICNAAQIISEKQREQIKVDMEEVEILHNVCLGFRATLFFKWGGWVQIPWHFEMTKENYIKFIDPWFKKYTSHIDFIDEKRGWMKTDIRTDKPKWLREVEAKIDKGEMSEEEAIEKYDHHVFYLITNRLSVHGFRDLRNQFLMYALPKVNMLHGKLARLVTPALYNEILRFYTTKPQEAEQFESVVDKRPRKR